MKLWHLCLTPTHLWYMSQFLLQKKLCFETGTHPPFGQMSQNTQFFFLKASLMKLLLLFFLHWYIWLFICLYLLFRFFLLHCLILAFLCTAEIDFIHSTHFLYRLNSSTIAQIFIVFLISIPIWTAWCVTVTEYDVQLFKLKRIKFIWC